LSVSPDDVVLFCYMSLFKNIAGMITGQKYVGVLPGSLPASTRWSSSDYLKALDISLYTDRALSKRAEKVGEVEWIVRDKAGEPILGHKVLDVLNYPNDYFSGPQFWGLYQKYYDVLGVAYIVKDIGRELFESSKIQKLHLLRPDMVKPIYSKDNSYIEHYEYRTNSGTIRYESEQVVMIFNPDPSNPLQGRSLLKSGIQTIQTEVQISAYHARVLENGGKVEGVFKFKTPRLGQEQLQQLKDDYAKEYADARKAGTPLFLGGDSDYLRTGLTPDELSYLEAKKMTLEDIIIMTGVPKPILGSLDDVQFSNSDAAIRIFLRETIKPLLNNLATSLDRTLVGDGETLTFVDPTPENIEEELKITESGIKNYFMTINEARVRHGYDELPDGDVIMIPFNLLPLGTEAKAKADDIKVIKSTKEIEHPLRDEAVRKKYGAARAKKEDSQIVGFNETVKSYMEAQRDRLIKTIDTRKSFKTKTLLDDTFNIELETKLAKASFLPTLASLLAEAGDEAMALAGSSFAFNVTATITTWMDKRLDDAGQSINTTTHKQLAKQFEESFAAGETRDQLIGRIEATYEGISTGRAASIARTEVHNANQFGTMEGYKQGNLPIKIWVSVTDANTRGNDPDDIANHLEMDGEEVPLEMPFSNGLMYPGDSRGSAAETINCRCQI
jgi:HK97 family phage portal protein